MTVTLFYGIIDNDILWILTSKGAIRYDTIIGASEYDNLIVKKRYNSWKYHLY